MSVEEIAIPIKYYKLVLAQQFSARINTVLVQEMQYVIFLHVSKHQDF